MSCRQLLSRLLNLQALAIAVRKLSRAFVRFGSRARKSCMVVVSIRCLARGIGTNIISKRMFLTIRKMMTEIVVVTCCVLRTTPAATPSALCTRTATRTPPAPGIPVASPPLLAPNLKSNKIRPRKRTVTWGHSSVGRAPALQAGGREFDSHCFHQIVPCWLCWRLCGSVHYLTAIPAKNLSAADEVLRTHGLFRSIAQ